MIGYGTNRRGSSRRIGAGSVWVLQLKRDHRNFAGNNSRIQDDVFGLEATQTLEEKVWIRQLGKILTQHQVE